MEEAVRSAGGTSWRLVAGRADERVRLNLGRVSEDEADRARDLMQRQEDAGRAARVLKLHDDDPTAATRALLGIGHLPIEAMLPAPAVDYKRLTVREYFEGSYLPPDVEKRGYRAHRAADRPATWRTEEGHWRRLLEGLGDVRLADIESRTFLRWVRDLKVEKSGGVRRGTARNDDSTVPNGARVKPASGAYQRLLRSALQALLTHAYTEGHIDTHVRLGELRIRGSTRAARQKTDPLTLHELEALIESSVGKFRAMWAVAGGEGLRPSELCRLGWEHARWDTKTMAIPGTKTEASADEIPMTPIAYRELRAWWVACGQPSAGVMFPADANGDDKGKPYTAESGYKRSLATAARRAGIERPVTPYLLRHSFATIAYLQGVPRDVTRRIGRWTDDKMLIAVYERPAAADLVERVAAFDVSA